MTEVHPVQVVEAGEEEEEMATGPLPVSKLQVSLLFDKQCGDIFIYNNIVGS